MARARNFILFKSKIFSIVSVARGAINIEIENVVSLIMTGNVQSHFLPVNSRQINFRRQNLFRVENRLDNETAVGRDDAASAAQNKLVRINCRIF